MKLAALLRRVPVVFDVFILLRETVIADRGLRDERSWLARALAFVDRLSCRCADIVLADTPEDADHFARVTGIPRDRLRVLWVGAQDRLFHPLPDIVVESRRVFFHGTYIPLHGIETIVRAAKLLEDDGISVIVLGAGQERPDIERLVATLRPANLELRAPVPIDELPIEIARSAVCLGIFGTTAKAARVVPNKVFEYTAVGRPTITGDTPAARSAFGADEIEVVPPGDHKALATAIRALVADPERAAALAGAGHARYLRDYGEEALASLLDRHLTELLAGTRV